MQKICIVVPCYNEAFRLPLDDFASYFKGDSTTHVCFVNDGSTDNTLDVLRKLSDRIGGNSFVVDLISNKGKAEAVRIGFNACLEKDFDFVGFFDADLATPLNEIDHFIRSDNGALEHDMVFGSRLHRMGAHIERIPSRHYMGRVFSTFASLILRLQIYDTQCGAKLFSVQYASVLFAKPFISKWLFDIELISRAIEKFGRKRVTETTLEVPLDVWIEKGDSKIKPMYFLQAPFDLIRIAWSYRKGLAKK